uniref:Uncharacterized protein n=1 Tax=Arundo donax TaxID=35708 RepID=A0A0A9HC26_ARUDO
MGNSRDELDFFFDRHNRFLYLSRWLQA